VEPTRTPSPNHLEFDQLCSGVQEFEPLPELQSRPLEREPEEEDDSSIDSQILAGLVSP
jgi:hypothetical protein